MEAEDSVNCLVMLGFTSYEGVVGELEGPHLEVVAPF